MTAPVQKLAAAIPRGIAPIVAFGLYLRTVGFDLVWDDQFLLFLPATMHCHLPSILLGPGNGLEYLPVRDLVLCAEHFAFGQWIGGFHLANAVVFGCAVHQVQGLYRDLLADRDSKESNPNIAGLSIGCGLLFALHPIHVEAVAFITGLNGLLALFFTIVTLRFYARSLEEESGYAYEISVILTGLALFSKAIAAALPGLLLALHLFRAPGDSPGSALRRLLPHIAVTLIAIGIHLVVAGATGVMADAVELHWSSRILRVGFIPFFYGSKLIWPFSLSVEYVLRDLNQHGVWIALSTLGLFGATGWVALRFLKKRGLIEFLFLCALASLVPVSNFFPTTPPVADRYAEIFSIFAIPLVAIPLALHLPRNIALGLAAAASLGLATLTHQQIGVWENEEALFGHATRVDGRASESWRALGHLYWRENRFNEAEIAFRNAAEIDPQDALLPTFMGTMALRRGDLDSAKHWLDKALEKEGAKHQVYAALAALYEEKHDTERAITYYERALEEAKSSPVARMNQGFFERVNRDLRWLRERPAGQH